MPSPSFSTAIPTPEIREGSGGTARRADSACFGGLLLLLFWVPLPLGSNRVWSLSLLAIGACMVFASSCWLLLLQGRSPSAYLAAGRWPLLALGLYALLVAGQMAGGPQSGLLRSVDIFQTRHYLLASLAYLAAFASVMLLVRDERRMRLFMLALLASGVLQALLAIALFSFKARYQFMHVEIEHGMRATGTFVNFNHLAAYLYLCLGVGVGLLIAGLKSSETARSTWRQRLLALLHFLVSPRMLVRLMLVVMVVALVLTRSRMGNTSFFTAVLLIGVLVAVRFRHSRRLALFLVASLLVVDLVAIGQWVGLDQVVARLEATALEREEQGTEETVEARTEPARYTVAMVGERPWLGHGGGTYFTAFPRFKAPGMRMYFDHAHNDYAEIAADAGLIGLALLAGVALLSAWRALHLLHPEQSPQGRAAGCAVLMAVTSIALHSTVDFGLQIPAVAFTFVLVLSLVWAVPFRRERAKDELAQQ